MQFSASGIFASTFCLYFFDFFVSFHIKNWKIQKKKFRLRLSKMLSKIFEDFEDFIIDSNP